MTVGALSTLLESLDEAGIETHGDDWDDLISQRLGALESSYAELRDPDREVIDYGDLVTHAAYTFMYAIGRAEFTYEVLKRVRNAVGSPLFACKKLNVASLGGGPASELAGLVKYLDDPAMGEVVTDISYTLFDKEEEWSGTAEALVDCLATKISVEINFVQADVCDSKKCGTLSLSDFDLIILSFFISEVCALPEKNEVIKSLNHLLSTATKGAAVLYNDSDAYSFYSFFNCRIWAAKRFKQLVEVQETLSVSPDFCGIYEGYIDRSGRTPHLNSKAVAKFLRRE